MVTWRDHADRWVGKVFGEHKGLGPWLLRGRRVRVFLPGSWRMSKGSPDGEVCRGHFKQKKEIVDAKAWLWKHNIGVLVILLYLENRTCKHASEGLERGEQQRWADQLRDRNDFARSLQEPLDLRKVKSSSCVRKCSVVYDSVIPWSVAHQIPLFMGFSRQEYWSEFPRPPPGDLLDQQNPLLLRLLHWQAGSLPRRHVGNSHHR